MELHELTVTQAAAAIGRREISPVELVKALLKRIDRLEPELKAWVTIDREGALATARQSEAEVGREGNGPLHGVPIGVKDIFDVKGMPTTCGTPIFKENYPAEDAFCVAKLRAAGAIVLGKTVTVQFAHLDPPPTRNPWNLNHTPGGSSSGSAAGVAARMIPAGLGSQTGGSIVRPAAFCGVVGVKPTYGRISRRGVFPDSWTLDQMGSLSRSVEDAALLTQIMAGRDPLDQTSLHTPPANYAAAAKRKDRAPRLGLIMDTMDRADPEMAEQLKVAAQRFEAAGAEVREVRLPRSWEEIQAVRSLICEVEMSDVHAPQLRAHPEGYAPAIRGLVEVGQLLPGAAYVHAQRIRRRMRPAMEAMLDGVDCLLLASAVGEAPDTSSTGDSVFQAPWSLFGMPSITLPSALSKAGLPLGVQLIAPKYGEEEMFSVAAWCEAVLGPMPSPLA
jgi:aspartyl-tRNA(Asn)/glutamyl-tRNA(Gln) amidotransferase subunit A